MGGDSGSEWDSSGEDFDFYETSSARRQPARKLKKRKITHKGRGKVTKTDAKSKTPEVRVRTLSFDPLLQALREQSIKEWEDDADTRDSFEEIIAPWLSECEQAERQFLQSREERDELANTLQPLSRQSSRQIRECTSIDPQPHMMSNLLVAKSRLQPRALRKLILNRTPSYERHATLTLLPTPRTAASVNPQVLDALYAIQTTPYENSFLSRLRGYSPSKQSGVIAVDWETRAPWMELMSDIREHHALSHPEREQAVEADAPITYCSLQACHLPQVHDLLARVFWEGIDVSDALDYSPEKCTVVATYKQLVVGAAFLSSPQDTYITYLAVRAGWDNSQIATSMLYHLISRNPNKDITLHVSITNPAMLLYNRFGFKAEEFIVGFYEDYLDPNSPQSKNAFRLRLRR
ncbi:hypothetical protein OH77DRAFT_1518768 [Trametes cingulata]|nr:hypothetical protein OH77DRAFT_1518768 [Trametes cingulata]